MSSALFLIIYWAVLIIPGAALDKTIYRNKHHGPLAWVALSYTSFVLIFISSNYFKLSATSISIAIAILFNCNK